MALIDVKKSVTSRPTLEPRKDADGNWMYDGFVPCHLEKVSVEIQKHEKGEFAGMNVPVIRFDFVNYKKDKGEVTKYFTHSEKVVGSKTKEGDDTYVDRKEDDIANDITIMWSKIKCILQACKNSANYREIENLSAKDAKEYLNLPETGTPKARIDAFGKFFNFIADFFNGDDGKSPMNVDAKGELLPFWITLVPEWNQGKYYTLPRYVGKGIIEPMRIEKGVSQLPQIIKINVDLKLRVGPRKAKAGGGGDSPAGGGEEDLDKMIAESNRES